MFQKGKIFFVLSQTDNIDHLKFNLPKGVKITNVNWTNKDIIHYGNYINYKNGTDYLISSQIADYGGGLYVWIENLNREQKEYKSTFILNFEGKLYPNAIFEFIPSGDKIRPPGGFENGAFFKFNLGDKYICTTQLCYESFRENEIEFHKVGNDLVISTLKYSSGWKDVSHHIFSLYFNKENNKTLLILREFSLGLFLLGVIPTIELGFNLYYKRKKK